MALFVLLIHQVVTIVVAGSEGADAATDRTALGEARGSVGSGEGLILPEEKITPTLRQTAMPDLGEGRLASILDRHYKDALGGPENWANISSLKISASLRLESGELSMTALQKKPNLIKMTLRRKQQDLVLGYDGTDAWQHAPSRDVEPTLMGPDEARRFIHSARFGNYLLFPYAEGKSIVYLDTVPVEGSICHQIRVTLENGFQVDYFIDIRSYLEVKVESTDLQNGAKSELIYSDYTRENGIPIARKVESYEDGQWVSTLALDEAKVNAGVVPWMFEMPR